RFVPFWLRTLEAAGIAATAIIPYRNPLEVALSLRRRSRIPMTEGLLLWLRHVLDAEVATREIARGFVAYDQLLHDWRAPIRRLGLDLGLAWPETSEASETAVEEFLDDDLRHHSMSSDAVSAHPAAFEWADRTFRALDALLHAADAQD